MGSNRLPFLQQGPLGSPLWLHPGQALHAGGFPASSGFWKPPGNLEAPAETELKGGGAWRPKKFHPTDGFPFILPSWGGGIEAVPLCNQAPGGARRRGTLAGRGARLPLGCSPREAAACEGADTRVPKGGRFLHGASFRATRRLAGE